MLVIAISSIVVYNKSSADTRSAEDVLIKGLSHDLRAPLESLSASVEAWKQADASEKNALSKSVISDVSRMDSIIKRQLRLRDMSAGQPASERYKGRKKCSNIVVIYVIFTISKNKVFLVHFWCALCCIVN